MSAQTLNPKCRVLLAGMVGWMAPHHLLQAQEAAAPPAAEAVPAPPAEAAPAAEAPPPAPPAAEAAPAQSELEEVIVTATRRAQMIKDVPIAVTAITGEDMASQQVANFADAVRIAPGPTFVPVKGTSVISVQIRGRSSTNDATSLGNPVGVFIDDIYYGSLASFDADFFDVQQLAILRGPQGTTFGRNVVGGALQITSNRAEIGSNAAQFSVTGLSTGDHPGFETRGFANLPLADDMAARIAFSTKDNEGYQHNQVTGSDLADNRLWSVRGSLTYEPSDTLRITGMTSYSHRDNLGDGPAVIGDGALAARQRSESSDLHDVYVDADGRTKRSIFAGMLRADWDNRLGTLAMISGYRKLNASVNEDADGGPYALNDPSLNTNNEWQFSQELRLTSPSGRVLEYIAGIYYGTENLRHSIFFDFDGTIPESRLSTLTGGTVQTQVVTGAIDTTSFGPYVEGKWHITPTLAATAGLRYVYEDKSGYTEHVGTSAFYGGPYHQELSKSWSGVTPRFILEYKPAADLLFYASVSNGYQTGGWSLTARTAEAATVPLEPEKTWSYELGTKSAWFDRRLSANVALYQATTEDLQVRSLVGPVLTDTNAGEMRARGVELELAANPARGIVLGTSYAYTDAEYTDFRGCAAGGVDCTGNDVPFTPKHDLTLYATYVRNLPNNGSLSLRIEDKNASKYELVATNQQDVAVPLTERKHILSASATYDEPQGDWSLQLWGRNLTDETIVTNALAYSFYLLSPAETGDAERATIAPPRTVGLTFTYRFQ